MIKIAVCDDEAYMLEELYEKINAFFSGEGLEIKITRFQNGESLLKAFQEFDIIFLDIQMQGLDGIQTAKALRKSDYRGFLIFVTVMQEQVFEAFEVQAYDYLVKPIEPERFCRTMKRLAKSLNRHGASNLLLQKGTQCRIIPFEDIIYCEVINRKSYIHTRQKETIDYYEKIESLERKLDGRFYRCHRSFIVNLSYLLSFKNGAAYVRGGIEIPVSRLRSQEFKEAILQYMKDWRY